MGSAARRGRFIVTQYAGGRARGCAEGDVLNRGALMGDIFAVMGARARCDDQDIGWFTRRRCVCGLWDREWR